MKYIYVLIKNDDDDILNRITVFLDKESAIKASKIFKNSFVEIFETASFEYNTGYKPIYSHYKNGEIEDD